MSAHYRHLRVVIVCLFVCACLAPFALAAGKKGKSSAASRRARAEKGDKNKKSRKAKESQTRRDKKGRRLARRDDDDPPRSRRGRKAVAKRDRQPVKRQRESADEEVGGRQADGQEREAEVKVNYPIVPDRIEVIEHGSDKARVFQTLQVQRLNLMANAQHVSNRRLSVAIDETRVTEIQEALAKRGYLTELPTGSWDQFTYEAMRRFQTEHKVDVTGYPTAHSLKLLGLTSW
jgi:hemolysin activation/secretion protein